jgi:hypothetical protein
VGNRKWKVIKEHLSEHRHVPHLFDGRVCERIPWGIQTTYNQLSGSNWQFFFFLSCLRILSIALEFNRFHVHLYFISNLGY